MTALVMPIDKPPWTMPTSCLAYQAAGEPLGGWCSYAEQARGVAAEGHPGAAVAACRGRRPASQRPGRRAACGGPAARGARRLPPALGLGGRYGTLPVAVIFYRNYRILLFAPRRGMLAIRPGVNRRTGPSEFLLSRTPISPSGRLATSTQLLLEKLRELLVQYESEPGRPGRPSGVRLSMSLPRWMSCDLCGNTPRYPGCYGGWCCESGDGCDDPARPVLAPDSL